MSSSSWTPDSTYVPPRSKFYVYDGLTDSGGSYHSSDFCFPQERSPAIHGDGGKSRCQPAAQHVVDYEGRPWAPRRKYANVENEECRKALREDRGHTSCEDRGHTSCNTWAYERSRSGLQRRSPTRPTPGRKPSKSETKDSRSAMWSSETEDSRSAAWNSETLDLHSVAEMGEAGQQRNVGFVEHNTPQRPQREQGLKQCGVQRESRAPADLSAWALNTHDLLWETQDLQREKEKLRLRLQRLETRLVILETIVDRKDKGDVQRTSIMPKTLESSPEVGTQTPASRSRRWRR